MKFYLLTISFICFTFTTNAQSKTDSIQNEKLETITLEIEKQLHEFEKISKDFFEKSIQASKALELDKLFDDMQKKLEKVIEIYGTKPEEVKKQYKEDELKSKSI